MLLIRMVQTHHYASELSDVKRGLIPPKLAQLYPFLDNSGLLRVGGRLHRAPITSYRKHPYILPEESWLSLCWLIIFILSIYTWVHTLCNLCFNGSIGLSERVR